MFSTVKPIKHMTRVNMSSLYGNIFAMPNIIVRTLKKFLTHEH